MYDPDGGQEGAINGLKEARNCALPWGIYIVTMIPAVYVIT